MMGIICVLFYMAYQYLDPIRNADASDQSNESVDAFFDGYDRSHLTPNTKNTETVHHQYYSLGYVEKYEQPAWVCYVLNKDELRMPNVKRYDRFLEDKSVSTGSATYYDYRGSGYSRGHLAPAGDMAFSEEAMMESFYMSNMSPQRIPFNGGIWRELEESVRDWAFDNDHLYVITGPILDEIDGRVGKNKVAVPRYFYKAVMDIDGNDRKGIAFIMPNEKSDRPIMDYAVTIDELEERLGFGLYDNLLKGDRAEESIESRINKNAWRVSDKRYQSRVKHWNNR